MTPNEPRTADFFTAMRSAFEDDNEWWWRDDYDGGRFWMNANDELLCREDIIPGNLAEFIVTASDLAATWTCDGSEP